MPDRPGLGRRLLDRLRRPPALPTGEAHALDLAGAIAALAQRLHAEVHTDPAAALGAAIAGRRVVVATTGDVRAAVQPFSGRPVPALFWVESAALPSPGSLPAGVVVFAPADLQEAVDLAVAGTRLAEDALCPVVLVVPPWTESEVLISSDADLVALVGHADELIPPPTDPQRALFGSRRPRVPRWFDAAHPMATGGAARDGLAAGRERSWEAAFEVPLGKLAQDACASVGRATGRLLPAVSVRGPANGEACVVAGALANEVPAGTRRIRPLRLRPFPAGYLAEGLSDTLGAAVLQDGSDTGPGSLFAAVEEASGKSPRLGFRPRAAAAATPELAGWVGAFLSSDADRARLGAEEVVQTAFPRRDAAVQALREAAPLLRNEAVAPGAPLSATPGEEPALPRALRRIESARPDPDSLPRFWGEVLQPLAADLPAAPSALLAAGAVPGAATALQPARRTDGTLPVLDPGLCTGCGACWAACPDSAFAATALTVPSLLDAAHGVARVPGKEAGAVKRAHKKLAPRLARALSDTAVPDRPLWRAAWDALAPKLKLGDDRAAHDAVWARTEDVLVDLRPFATDVLYDRAEAAQSGSGALLLLGVDPDACTGCGLCVASCEPEALERVTRTPENVAEARAHHGVHEGLPDTAGATLAWLEGQPEGDPVRALLLSRPIAEAQVGGGVTEPGSGARLAARLATAFAEEHGARGQAGLLRSLKDLSGGLRGRRESLLAAPAGQASAQALAAAAADGGRTTLEALMAQLGTSAAPATLDADAVRRVAEAEVAVGDRVQRLETGADGLGTARFAVVASAPALEPLLRFPSHPWFAPTTVVDPAEVVPVARALAGTFVDEHVATIRLLRRAELLVRGPGDLEGRLRALDSLSWADLEPADRAACPPLIVFVGPRPGEPADASPLTALLREDLPIRVVLLDGAEAPGEGADPALLAVAAGSAWVGSSSPAFPEHLGPTLRAALNATGPSLVVLHAPSPDRLGFASNRTLDVARKAVGARVAPLFRFDPSRDALHERFDLDGNPEDGAPLSEWLADQPYLNERTTHPENVARAVDARWQALVALAGPPPAPPEPPPPAAPPLRREDVEQELRTRLAQNLRRIARPGST